MNTKIPVTPVDGRKTTPFKKDAICLALVVIAVFILHAFSKSTVEQLYKTKEKNNTAIVAPAPATVF